jgi:hypothetical protein
VTAAVAWYTSAALVVNGQAGRTVIPVGAPLWKENGRVEREMPRHREITA